MTDYANTSVLNMTPAAGTVRFRHKEAEWRLPLVGWAVVVEKYRDLDPDSGREVTFTGTQVEPMIFPAEQGTQACMVRDYLEDFAGEVRYWIAVRAPDGHEFEPVEGSWRKASGGGS